MRFLLLVMALSSVPVFALQNQSVGVAVGASRDASITNIPSALGSAGAALFAGISGKTRIALSSTVTDAVGVSITTSTTNCSGGSQDITIPANGNLVFENIAINSNVCVFDTTGSAASTGVVTGTVW